MLLLSEKDFLVLNWNICPSITSVLLSLFLIEEFNVDENTANTMSMFTKYHDPNWAGGRCYLDALKAWAAVLSQHEIQAIYEKGYKTFSAFIYFSSAGKKQQHRHVKYEYTTFRIYFVLDG